MIYFGTDGVRGIANKDLTCSLAHNLGLALTKIKKNPKILVCSDTRVSKELILFSFVSGVLSGGGSVDDLKIAPTSMVSFLLTKYSYDFGVVISASHNPKEYNGIKIFDCNGQKINEDLEEKIETQIINNNLNASDRIGKYENKYYLQKKYNEYLIQNLGVRLNEFKVVLDLSNGASYSVAPKIYKSLGANVICMNKNDGDINDNCGALFLDNLKARVLYEKADIGIAFDGDADRIICIDHEGNIVDGDAIIYILAKSMKKRKLLKNNIVVGTSQTNLKIEQRLKNIGIDFVRTDVGDKYVIEKLNELDASLGGEQSGHIIIKDILPTGDGILAGLKILEVMKLENKSLKELFNIKLMPQMATNIIVKDKLRVKNNIQLNELINNLQKNFDGRIIVRCSGTENKMRILVEGKNKGELKSITNKIVKLISDIDK